MPGTWTPDEELRTGQIGDVGAAATVDSSIAFRVQGSATDVESEEEIILSVQVTAGSRLTTVYFPTAYTFYTIGIPWTFWPYTDSTFDTYADYIQDGDICVIQECFWYDATGDNKISNYNTLGDVSVQHTSVAAGTQAMWDIYTSEEDEDFFNGLFIIAPAHPEYEEGEEGALADQNISTYKYMGAEVDKLSERFGCAVAGFERRRAAIESVLEETIAAFIEEVLYVPIDAKYINRLIDTEERILVDELSAIEGTEVDTASGGDFTTTVTTTTRNGESYSAATTTGTSGY